MGYVRDYTMYAAIFGFFSFAWFGWAQEGPRKSWRKYIGAATTISLLVTIIGVYLSIQNWEEASALTNGGGSTTYITVVIIEFLLLATGGFLLIFMKKSHYVAPWVGVIVGVHFFFLVDVFQDPSLYLLGVIMTAVSLLSPWLAGQLKVANSAITGIGSGTILFCYALLGLARYWLI